MAEDEPKHVAAARRFGHRPADTIADTIKGGSVMASFQESASPLPFRGFVPDDFGVFALPGFDARMQELRGYLRPRLLVMADTVRPALEAALGRPLFPHVAAHLRRRVNPPAETWAAFGPSPRGYKSFAHFAVGIDVQGIFLRLVLKEEALQDRRFLGGLLGDDSTACLNRLPDHLTLHAEPEPPGLTDLSLGAVRTQGAAFVSGLLRTHDSQWAVGLDVARDDRRLGDVRAFTKLASQTLREVLPLWQVLPSWWNQSLWSPGLDEGGSHIAEP
jgi:uncharacterized protein YktB (UPF0637 family)